MSKKIKLSEIKVKSSVNELNQEQRKSTKGGYVFTIGGEAGKARVGNVTWIADTMVDIRIISDDVEGGLNP